MRTVHTILNVTGTDIRVGSGQLRSPQSEREIMCRLAIAAVVRRYFSGGELFARAQRAGSALDQRFIARLVVDFLDR
jgi:hypothetical protein